MIDWNKPIETFQGQPAKFIYTLESNYIHRYVVVYTEGVNEYLTMVDINGKDGKFPEKNIRNVYKKQEPLRFYGFNHNGSWLFNQGYADKDTHVIELTEDDLKRVMRKL